MEKEPKILLNETPTNTWTSSIDSTELGISEDVSNILDNNEEKITCAKEELSIEQYNALWEKFITHEKMTVDKLTVIGYMLSVDEIIERWAEKLANMTMAELKLEIKIIHAKNELSEEQYDAIERYLDYDGMTADKITLLKNLSPIMIKNWAELFINMTYSGLNDLIIVNNNSKQ